MSLSKYDVVIIGAGAAGIAAATRLLENNFNDFIICEGSDRIGGRVHSVPFGKGTVDLGAEWVHGMSGNVVYDMAEPFDLLYEGKDFFKAAEFRYSDGGMMDQDTVTVLSTIIDDAYEQLHFDQKVNHSAYDSIKSRYWREVSKVNINQQVAKYYLEWADKSLSSISGAPSLSEVSSTDNYEAVPGNQLNVWKSNGFSNVFKLLGKKNGDPCHSIDFESKIKLHKEVKQIIWDESILRIVCTDGSCYLANSVIVTLSLGVLKASAPLMFQPSLPERYLKTIEGLAIDICDKIFLEFPYRWWKPGSRGISFLWTEKDLEDVPPEREWTTKMFGFYRNDGQPMNVLEGWVIGSGAKTMEKLNEKEVTKHCMDLIRKYAHTYPNIPDPVNMIRTTWYKNPLFRGAYSYRSFLSDELDAWPIHLATPIKNNIGKPIIMFAGEATHERHYSTVHGAIETGWREANRILKTRKQSICKVVIIGGGMAGIAAATTLNDAGVDNIILEAHEELGGRIKTADTTIGALELGAQWIHDARSKLYEIALQNGFLAPYVSYEGLGKYCRSDGTAVSDVIVSEVSEVIENILKSAEKLLTREEYPSSMEELLETKYVDYLSRFVPLSEDHTIRKELYHWHKRFLLIDNSCHYLSDLSAKAWGRFDEYGDKKCQSLAKSFKELVKLLGDRLPKNSLRLGSVVKKIEWMTKAFEAKGPFITVSGDDFSIKADHVIVTSSLGYLKCHANDLFHPPLPAVLCEAIQKLGFGGLAKLFLWYDKPWWPQDINGYQLVWCNNKEIEDTVPWAAGIQGFDVLINKPCLLCWVGGFESETLENTADEVIYDQVTYLLQKFTGNYNIPKPSGLSKSLWNSDPFILGAYSHITPACDVSNISGSTLSEPVYTQTSDEKIPTLLLAGEACSSHHFSTIHGAFESGEEQAKVILSYLKKNS